MDISVELKTRNNSQLARKTANCENSSATIEIESEHKGKNNDLNYYSHCG
jgi:hypothetical protein